MQEKTFTRRGKIRAMTFLATGGVVLGGFALQGQLRAAASEALLARHYEYAFSELTAAVSELDTTLQKGQYATSAGLFSSLCSQAFRQALSAQTALGALPYGNVELEQTAAFLARTGDYALALARLEENSLTDEQRETFSALSQRASTLSAALESLQSDLYAGTLALDDVDAVERRLSQETENGEDVLAGSAFQDIEEGCSDLPTLIYDGPFSDHLLHASPKCLEGLETVNRDEARAAAAAFFGLCLSNGGHPAHLRLFRRGRRGRIVGRGDTGRRAGAPGAQLPLGGARSAHPGGGYAPGRRPVGAAEPERDGAHLLHGGGRAAHCQLCLCSGRGAVLSRPH